MHTKQLHICALVIMIQLNIQVICVSKRYINYYCVHASDTEMLQAMQALGFAVSFWTSRETSASGGARAEDELWTGVRGVLADAHYKRPATYLFVGTRKWIQNSILKV